MARPGRVRFENGWRDVEPLSGYFYALHWEGVSQWVEIRGALTFGESQHGDVFEFGRIGVVSEVEQPGWIRPGSTRNAIGEFGDFGLGNKGETSGIHSQNTPVFGGGLSAAEDDGRGSKGIRDGEFLSDEIALSQGAVSVEVGVVAEAILVTRSGKSKIGNSGFADGVIAREEREGRGERRVKRRRFGLGQFSLNFVVTLNPRELAAGV